MVMEVSQVMSGSVGCRIRLGMGVCDKYRVKMGEKIHEGIGR
jgi:hypothetical protein